MKKFISWDIFHLSLILSLLRLYPELYRSSRFESQPLLEQEVFLGPSSAYTQTHFHNLNNRLQGYIHPKNIDDSIVRTLFIHDLNRLSRHPSWADHPPQNDIIAYIVNGQQPTLSNTSASDENPVSSSLVEIVPIDNSIPSELTQEDMDLIEILWKQDIDLGISRGVFDGSWSQENAKEKEINASEASDLKKGDAPFDNPWQGLQYSIDSETGEHILVPAINISSVPSVETESSTSGQSLQEVPTVDFSDITLEEALQFFENSTTEIPELKPYIDQQPSQQLPPPENVLVDEIHLSLLEELKDLQDLVAESRNDSSTWPESLLLSQGYPDNITNPYAGLRDHLLPNSAPAYIDALLSDSSLPLPAEEQASSLNLTYEPSALDLNNDDEVDGILSLLTNGSDSDPFASIAAQYSGDSPMDILPGNLTADNDLISSILSQESLDLMDFTQMVSGGGGFLAEASNDSAISCNESKQSMDWFGSGSNQGDSACSENNTFSRSSHQQTPQNGGKNANTFKAAQKKYHFFGKHSNSDNESSSESSDSGCSNSVASYSGIPKKGYNYETSSQPPPPIVSSADALQPFLHNHTYHQAPNTGQKPFERNKKEEETEEDLEEQQNCRDEKRAKELKLPLTIKEITYMPIEEFNERLTKLDLTEEQSTLIRDIRRRGKNKVAAQNCRKRKMDQIVNLQKRLEDLEYERQKLMTEQVSMSSHREFLQSKYFRLYQFLFDNGQVGASGPPEPPGFFTSETPAADQRPADFAMARNGTGFAQQELEADSNKGARVKRKVNKNK